MQESYIPKTSENDLCEGINLCTIRPKLAGYKNLKWDVSEIPLDDLLNAETYNGFPIRRVYSSGYTILSEDKTKVLLATVEKNWKRQIQSTWWSPLEEEYKNVIYKDGWKYRFNLEMAIKNARTRAKNRLWIDIISEMQREPLVDFCLLESLDEDWKKYYKLVVLLHFLAWEFKGTPKATWEECAVDVDWYDIKWIGNVPWIAPSVEAVTSAALKI